MFWGELLSIFIHLQRKKWMQSLLSNALFAAYQSKPTALMGSCKTKPSTPLAGPNGDALNLLTTVDRIPEIMCVPFNPPRSDRMTTTAVRDVAGE
jgi:hypothetical protein